jgi:hypothetical protein
MMMAKRETIALMIALMPAAMALTMAMMQLPIVRKMDWIYVVLVGYSEVGGERTYARYYGAHFCGCVVVLGCVVEWCEEDGWYS